MTEIVDKSYVTWGEHVLLKQPSALDQLNKRIEAIRYVYEMPLRIVSMTARDAMLLTPDLDPGRSTREVLGYNDLPISTQLQCGVVTLIALSELAAADRARVLRKIESWDYSPLTRAYFNPETERRVRKKKDAAATFRARRHERARANRPSRIKKR